ncbi:hypothetical protein [Pinisolibacter aquiterrae]|uniref:hypothetical protein n=1 Tax=Pinisolibacter aquiterrae TaxID=2815579 RepID=UPI001C3E2820|nr:hypothetical protein [Pinisolibacter aquiterrae]MBV5262801.1 hypothetical protein [Pinisolibacter aquiterrae]MCC8233297.1 hypothetical protein [Pinisolibacter aquiterrae]
MPPLPTLGATVFAAAVFASSLPALALDCPVSRAVYTALDFDDDMSADAGAHNDYEVTLPRRSLPSGEEARVIRIVEKKQSLSYDFGIARPLGFGGTTAYFLGASTAKKPPRETDDQPRSRLIFFGEDLRRVDVEDDGDPKAPAYLQLPEISPAFWGWSAGARRFVPPDGLWKLAACR